MKKALRIISALMAVICLGCLFSCGKSENPDSDETTGASGTDKLEQFSFDGWYNISKDSTELKVKLDANITTGFNWFAEISDEEILRSSLEDYVADPTDEPVCGSGGTWISAFVPAGKDGDVTVTFRYQQEWEFNENEWDKKLDLRIESGTITVLSESGSN